MDLLPQPIIPWALGNTKSVIEPRLLICSRLPVHPCVTTTTIFRACHCRTRVLEFRTGSMGVASTPTPASREVQSRSDCKSALHATPSKAYTAHAVVPSWAVRANCPTYRPPGGTCGSGGGRRCSMTLGNGGACGSLGKRADSCEDMVLTCCCRLVSADK